MMHVAVSTATTTASLLVVVMLAAAVEMRRGQDRVTQHAFVADGAATHACGWAVCCQQYFHAGWYSIVETHHHHRTTIQWHFWCKVSAVRG
eukprot:m.1407503 g.1407503  ORF g.1407503 m.1407503 type:complete len:91 (+) comp25020_c0_seq1:2873-3145(+)